MAAAELQFPARSHLRLRRAALHKGIRRAVKHAERALTPGGIFVAYTPTIVQAVQLRETLEDSRFVLAETLEVLHRTWHVDGQSVRPDHRMVAHTGFLTVARKLTPTE